MVLQKPRACASFVSQPLPPGRSSAPTSPLRPASSPSPATAGLPRPIRRARLEARLQRHSSRQADRLDARCPAPRPEATPSHGCSRGQLRSDLRPARRQTPTSSPPHAKTYRLLISAHGIHVASGRRRTAPAAAAWCALNGLLLTAAGVRARWKTVPGSRLPQLLLPPGQIGTGSSQLILSLARAHRHGRALRGNRRLGITTAPRAPSSKSRASRRWPGDAGFGEAITAALATRPTRPSPTTAPGAPAPAYWRSAFQLKVLRKPGQRRP